MAGPAGRAGASGGPAELAQHDRGFADLDAALLHGILRLRVDVFVVEQACAYPELDGRDDEPSTRHVWLAPEGQPAQPVAYLRVLRDADAWRIGRVAVRADHRGAGLSRRLLVDVLQGLEGPVVLDAQAHLEGFYTSLGFAADGPPFVEDGIPHVPMRRPG